MTQAEPRHVGHGVKQRDVIRMSSEEIDEFLTGRRTMNMATINHDGTIHLVAMWYGLVDGAPCFETKAKSQKVLNLRRDPRITCLVEEGQSYEELRGVELVGRAEIVEDPDYLWRIGVSVFERYQGPYSEEMRPYVEAMLHKRVGVRVDVERVVSWDHAKLGLPPSRPAT
jgi:PPOX class probable F420-dependent enzyme